MHTFSGLSEVRASPCMPLWSSVEKRWRRLLVRLLHCHSLNLPLQMVSSNPGVTVGGGGWGGSRRRTSVSPSRWCLRALTLSSHWPVPMESPCYWLHPWQYSIFMTYCIYNLHYFSRACHVIKIWAYQKDVATVLSYS